MYLTEKSLRNIVNNILIEGNFSDPIAGRIAYCIASALGVYVMKSRATNSNAMPFFKMKFNFKISASRNKSINSSYDDNPGNLPPESQTDVNNRINKLIDTHNTIKNLLKDIKRKGRRSSRTKSLENKFL